MFITFTVGDGCITFSSDTNDDYYDGAVLACFVRRSKVVQGHWMLNDILWGKGWKRTSIFSVVFLGTRGGLLQCNASTTLIWR